MPKADAADVAAAFHELVNMTPHQLEGWLETTQSREVGQKTDGAESTGHQSGREIVTLLQTKKHDLTDDDFHQMQRVVGYIKRHLAQRPAGDIEHTRWAYSLKNWGHDPLKK